MLCIISTIENNQALGNITYVDAAKLKKYTLLLRDYICAHLDAEGLEEVRGMTDHSLMTDIDILCENYETRIENLEKNNDDLQKNNDDLQKSNDDLQKSNDDLQKNNDDLQKSNDDLQKKLDDNIRKLAASYMEQDSSLTEDKAMEMARAILE